MIEYCSFCQQEIIGLFITDDDTGLVFDQACNEKDEEMDRLWTMQPELEAASSLTP